MVVLSVAICTKSGKALLSRQFVEMTRIRIEGLLSAFPKLMSSDGKQHTYVETDSVRYVYQPMEELYLLLITNKASNIIEDLETLRLLSKVVPDIAGTANNLTEDKITQKCFELIFAFDEVITAGGYKEPITLQQIRTNLEMESHEEKLHNMIKISKMETARDMAKDAAKNIRIKQAEDARLGRAPMSGLGGGEMAPMAMPEARIEPSPYETPVVRPSAAPTKTAAKGMSLSSKGAKNKSLEDSLFKEDKLAPVVAAARGGHAVVEEVVAQSVVQHPVMLQIAERVNAKLTRDGTAESLDIKGSLTLTASTDEAGMCGVKLSLPRDASSFTFNTHPKVNKAMFDKSHFLQLKDTTKGFPSARPVGILRWSYAGASDDMVPIKINCWPEEEARGQMNVSIEYSVEVDIDLHNVEIVIPLGTSESPQILNADGNYRHVSSSQELHWTIDMIDESNKTGSLEFTIAQRNADAFFPVNVNFSSQELFCKLDVAAVNAADGHTPIMYGLSKGMAAEEYVVE
ncbi:unnamed protein product [Ectocarpus fasciculatus]